MLILGDPGSGKTVTLLQLARELLEEAYADYAKPVPMILNLSTWTPTITVIAGSKPKEVSVSFDEWIVEKVSNIYDQLSPELARSWLDKNRLILLLDGLDEVSATRRDNCLQAINDFRSNPKTEAVRMVLCSRTQEYEQLSTQVDLQTAIVLQPLTELQITTYIQRDELEGLRQRIKADQLLADLAKSAFVLSIMTRAYRGLREDQILSEGTKEERLGQLFNQYIDTRFREKHRLYYRPKEAVHYLTWLSAKMTELSITIVAIDSMNEEWLPENKRDSYWMVAIGSGIVGGLGAAVLSAAILRSPSGGITGAVGKTTGKYVGKKYILRELRNEGHIPPNYEHFLDSMTEIDLLRKAGDQYMFIHRMLLEHFAELSALQQKKKLTKKKTAKKKKKARK